VFPLASGLQQLDSDWISPAAGKHLDDPVQYISRLSAGERYQMALHAVPDYVKRAKKKYGSPERAYKEIWGNSDGVLSAAEWTRETQRLEMLPVVSWMAYQVLDADEDGSVTPEEFYAAVGDDGAMDKFTPEETTGPGGKLDAGAQPAAGPARGDSDFSRRFADAGLVVDDFHAQGRRSGVPRRGGASNGEAQLVPRGLRRSSRSGAAVTAASCSSLVFSLLLCLAI